MTNLLDDGKFLGNISYTAKLVNSIVNELK